ncbi:MAG: DUF2207 domain-containing protein [Bacilli bacterium]|nr:DUF2207 domain-containing protein [Bacilli bacterium]
MKKKLIFVFISFFLLVFPFSVNATTDGFTITKYDVKIIVNENNTLDVTETITAVFDQYGKHGIKRALPTHSTYRRKVDGREVDIKQKVKYKNISINEDYTTETGDGYKTLKIGKSYKTLDINQPYTYIIKYTYDTGDDMIDEYDDLYFNLIGTEWTAKIEEATFTIVMPKEFATSNEKGSLINFSTGYYGNAYNKGVNYKVDGKMITGFIEEKYDGVALNEREGLTVRIELPNGYFVGARKHYDLTPVILVGTILILILMMLGGLALFVKFGLRKKKTMVVRYTAPDGVDPALAGFLYKGIPESNDIVALITYLATKGYLKIIDDKGSKFKLQFLKPLDESEPNYIKTTFKGLFKKADEDGIVTKKDLTNKFYTSLNTALSQLGKTYIIYAKSHDRVIAYNIFMAIISFCFILIPVSDALSYKVHTVYAPLYAIFWVLIPTNIILQLVLSICTRKRTDEAEKLYADVAGYREFIDKVDVNKINTLVEEDPQLFYNVLPYAYVFGLTNKWIKKFESIKLEPPTWYEGNIYDIHTGAFRLQSLTSGLDSITASAKTTMSSRPYESSGGSGGFGGGGGGGFSGGGGGGGGGSSW